MPHQQSLQVDMPSGRQVDALYLPPAKPSHLLILAHGAGAGMHHPFMESLAAALADVHIATLRYQFPYMQERRRVPDLPALLTATVAAAVRTAHEIAPGIPLIAGGKSMGGRMTSQAASQNLLPTVKGLVFFGFPLHPPNRPGIARADHLSKVETPMLFLQGARDNLADLSLLRPVIQKLGPRATLHVLDSADHSFHVLKSSGSNDAAVLHDLAQTAASWATSLP